MPHTKKNSLTYFYRKPQKSLYGHIISLSENSSTFEVQYNNNNLSLRCGVMYPFSEGTRYANENISNIANSNVVRIIKDNANMVYFGVTYYFSRGKSSQNLSKSLQNSDNDRGIKSVDDN